MTLELAVSRILLALVLSTSLDAAAMRDPQRTLRLDVVPDHVWELLAPDVVVSQDWPSLAIFRLDPTSTAQVVPVPMRAQ